ncbi:hypothetical protein ACH4VR_16015 [Streptomyces sp. NPDC020883]|uniref:hypothetical protein n=1 Tax=Streptomyces sp. NPDC020883 TaxID=3365099 RepID=UPI003796A950
MGGVRCRGYGALRALVQGSQRRIPGKLEITREGLVHDVPTPSARHEFTVARVRRLLEKLTPERLVVHSGMPDVEDVTIGEWTIATRDLPRYA